MNNLIIEASNWLRSDICRKGSIQERTKGVLSLLKEYIKTNKSELESITGRTVAEMNKIVQESTMIFCNIIDSYLRGVHYIAVASSKSYIKDINIYHEPKGVRLYKARKSESNYPFSNDEMFHIPYDKRYKIGNQRFSISGMPCLYLGASSYVCWEELERTDFTSCNFCGFTNISTIDIYDLVLPDKITDFGDIKRICMILACSLSANRNDVFKIEYILPQCFLQSFILRHHYYHNDKKIFGIKYLSSHGLNGDANCFSVDFGDAKWINRFVNYVFPAASSDNSGFNSQLKSLFKQTETTTMFNETLLAPEKIITGNSHDVYLDSQFGLMDAFLDEKMGFVPLRKEVKKLVY